MATKKVSKRVEKKDSRKSSILQKQGKKKFDDKDVTHWPEDAQKLVQELRVHQIEIEMQNEQLREVQKKQGYLASFPEMNPNPVVAVNLEGSVQYLNPAARQLFPDLQDIGSRHEWLTDLKSIGTLLKEEKRISYFREIRIDSAWFEQIFFLTPIQDQFRIYGRDITEHKEAEEALEAIRTEAENERRRLEAVMEALPVGVAITDAQGGNIRSNNAYEQVWGSPRPAAASVSDYADYKAWWSETGKPVVPEDWASSQAVQKGKAVVGQLLEIQRFDGSRASVINSGAPVFDANGQITGSAVAIQDITDLRKAEQALRSSLERYRSYIEVTGELGWTTNADGEVVEDIPAWRKFTGQSEEETKGAGWVKALHPDDVKHTMETWNNAVATKSAYEVEYRIRRYDGVYRHFWVHGVPVVKEDGSIREWVGTCVDITERKQIEDAQMFLVQCGLPGSGEDFFKSLARYLAENLGMDYVCIDRLQEKGLAAQTVAIYFDGKIEDNLTYTLKDTPCGDVVEKTICCFPNGVRHLYPQDVVLQEMMAESYVGTILWSSKGRPIGLIAIIGRQPLANPQLAESMLKLVAVRAAGELERREAEEALRQRSLELQQLTETLEQRVLERTAELATSNQALQFEIEERKQAEEALRQSEMKYRIVADNTYDWEWWRNPEGIYIYVSPSCKRVTHHEAEEFIKDPDLLLKIFHPDDKSSFIRHRIEVEEKHTTGEIEFRILRPDGSFRWLAHACQPVFDEQGRFLGRRGSNRDITERKCAEEALRESEEQLRYLSSKLLTAQETERRRISRELHDELGGSLAALKLRSNFIKKNLQNDQTDLREECQSNEKYIDQIIENVHRLSRDLSPPVLEDLGLSSALRWLIDHFVKHYDIKVRFDNIDVDHRFSREVEIMIFRIFQEAFTNIGKHAQAKNVSVIIKKDVDRLSFLLEDDGNGFDPNKAHMGEATERGMGLATMRERARLLGGSFDLQSQEGKGTLIMISVPIKTKDGEGL